MGYDIKLNIFTITLRERYKKNSQLNWKELFSQFSGRKYEKKFENFFFKYIAHFDGKFTVYNNWNKGISLGKNSIAFASINNYIIGKVEGGSTNLVHTVKSKSNIDDPGFQVTKEHVNSIPHHFVLWLPRDSNKGLLIVQNLGDRTLHEPLKLNFKKFVESNHERSFVDFKEYITEEAINKMRNGSIKQLILRKSSLPSDRVEKVFNKKYNIVDNINIEIKITGFGNHLKNAIKDFFSGKYPDLLEFDSMKEVGIDDSSEILAIFEHNNKQAIAKLDNFNLTPVYYVDTSDVPLNTQNHPDEKKLKTYLVSFLSQMQKEIGYTN